MQKAYAGFSVEKEQQARCSDMVVSTTLEDA